MGRTMKHYEKPRKKMSFDITYDVYYNLRKKAKELNMPMTKVIQEALEDVIEKYGGVNITADDKKSLVDVLFNGENIKAEDNEDHLQFIFKGIE